MWQSGFRKAIWLLLLIVISSGATALPLYAADAQDVVLYFVRHGKTIFNTTGQVQGWSDTPLTEVGVQGAKDVAYGLKEIDFVLAYASDMGRAVSTAEIIMQTNKKTARPVVELSGLREWFYGGYEGKTNAEMWIPIFEQQGLKFDENWTQYGELTRRLSDREIADIIAKNDPTQTAERYEQIVSRSGSAMDQILREARAKGGGNVLVVAHGGIIPTILESMQPGSYQGEDIGNSSVTRVRVKANNSIKVETIGDNSYLQTGKKARENRVVRLYLVRHGKTLFNTTGQVQGWSDTPLTEVGIKGAKALGRGMSAIPFSRAYSSDMGRAASTARYVLDANRQAVPVLTKMSGLREWNYGGYEGKTNAEMWIPIFEKQGLAFDENWTHYGELTRRMSDADIANAIRANDPLHTAETYDAITARSRAAIEQIIAESAESGGNVLIVAHGGIIPTILESFVPGSYKGEDIGNAYVSIMEYQNGRFTVKSIGDMSFLKKGSQ